MVDHKEINWTEDNKNKVFQSTNKLRNLVDDNPNHFKTRTLGGSLKNYSNQMERDILGKRRRNRTFKYGTLVYVDFGINFGSEFSAPHYAITLDKNDSKNKNTITVVPLTSKKGFSNLKLEESISKRLGEVQAYLGHEYVDKVHGELLKEMKALITNYLLYNPHNYDLPSNHDDKEFLINTYDKALKRFKDIQKIFVDDQEMLDYAKKRMKKYVGDLDKTTYVKLDAITTIDKNKIFRRKNDLDPLGIITLPDSELNIISQGLSKMLLFDNK